MRREAKRKEFKMVHSLVEGGRGAREPFDRAARNWRSVE